MSELPNGWFSSRLEDIVEDVSYGFTASSSGLPIGPKMLRITDIQDRKVDWNSVPYCNANSTELSKYRLKGGDLVFARTGATVGKSFLIQNDPENAVYASYLIRVRAYPEVDNRYLSYYFQSPDYWEQITEFSAGVGQPNVNGSKLKNLILPLAPLNEQKRIADKLDRLLARVDAAKARLDKIPALLKRLRQAILAAATTGKLTEEWREEKGINVTRVDLNIQSVANVGTGSTPLRKNELFYAKTGTPWVTSAATSNPFVTESQEFVTDAAIKAHRLKIYPPGTLLVAMYGEGKTRGQVAELRIDATINQACAAILVDESRVKKAYIKLVLQANYLEMRELAGGGNQPNLNLSKIKDFPLSLPMLGEQDEIVRRVEELFAIADRIEAQYSAARARVDRLTQSLLAKAFRGELVPQDPNDEPATALLERIRAQRAAAPKLKRGQYRKAAIQELPMVAEEQGNYTRKMSRRSQSGKKSK